MVEHIKRDSYRLVEEFTNAPVENPFSKVIPALMKKGLENVNLSMFSEEKKRELLNAAGEEYLKRTQVMDAIKIFKGTDNKQRLNEIGDEHYRLGLYNYAIEAYKIAQNPEKLLKTEINV